MFTYELSENGLLNIKAEIERIDTTNAPAVETELFDIVDKYCKPDKNGNSQIVLDAEKVAYVSSVGLRILLKLLKKNIKIRVINASTELYEIFDMTGFTQLLQVEKAFREISVEGCDIIGEGAKGIVYRYKPDTIVKVYKRVDSLDEIKREKELAQKALLAGIDTAISFDVVKVGDKYASVFELLDANSMSREIAENPEKLQDFVKIYTDLLKKIHSTEVKEGELPSAKRIPRRWVLGVKQYFDDFTNQKISDMVEAIPDRLTMVHGDYHTNNIMLQNEDEPMLIDMDTLSCGHPVIELANTYITYKGFCEVDPENVEQFLGMKHEFAEKFWEVFLPMYFEGETPDKIKEKENKIRLLAYLRLLQRVERMDYPAEKANFMIDYSKGKILELLEKVDSFDF